MISIREDIQGGPSLVITPKMRLFFVLALQHHIVFTQAICMYMLYLYNTTSIFLVAIS
jgi:hypothetical protein